jgi:hypothetical protein
VSRVRLDQPPKLLLFSRTCFTAGVADEAVVRPDVELIGIDRLYGGSCRPARLMGAADSKRGGQGPFEMTDLRV